MDVLLNRFPEYWHQIMHRELVKDSALFKSYFEYACSHINARWEATKYAYTQTNKCCYINVLSAKYEFLCWLLFIGEMHITLLINIYQWNVYFLLIAAYLRNAYTFFNYYFLVKYKFLYWLLFIYESHSSLLIINFRGVLALFILCKITTKNAIVLNYECYYSFGFCKLFGLLLCHNIYIAFLHKYSCRCYTR